MARIASSLSLHPDLNIFEGLLDKKMIFNELEAI
jgi:hypothetical protein